MRKQIRRSAQGLIGDVLKKMPLSGVADIRVPSDIRRILVANIENLRESALDIFAKEISKVLSKLDIQHVVADVLNNYTLRVEARVDLMPKAARKKKNLKRRKK
jgi:hypothetical protein